MVKRYGNLFESIASIENLRVAFQKASRGKRHRTQVKVIEDDLENKLAELHHQLINGTYTTSSYKTKQIYEPKERTIYILPFYPDRIVHHAIMNVIEPILDGMLIDNTFSCRKGKGQHAGSRKCMAFVRRNRYCLQCDISKFYPSIDHEKLKLVLRRKFKDERLLNLFDNIIDSVDGGKNVPIGNYLSQWFGNYYLTSLDRFIYEDLKAKDYLRYCDDFCLFSNDKTFLRGCADKISDFLENNLLLRLSKRRVYPVSQGVDFLGYRHFRKYILVRKSTVKRIRKNLNSVLWLLDHCRIKVEQAISKVASIKGWLRHAKTFNLRKALGIDELWEALHERQKAFQ